MSDLISRQDVINAFRKATADGDKVDFCVSVINDLPSAEPEIIRCKDCMYYHPSFCKIWSKFGTVRVKENGFCYKAERREE